MNMRFVDVLFVDVAQENDHMAIYLSGIHVINEYFRSAVEAAFNYEARDNF